MMVTVNNHWAGVEPCGIFDDLSRTRLEFVLRVMQAAAGSDQRGQNSWKRVKPQLAHTY